MSDTKEKKKEPSALKKLFDLANKNTTFLRDGDEVFVELYQNKVRQVYPLRSKAYRNHIMAMYIHKYQTTVDKKTIDGVLDNLEGLYSLKKEEVKVYTRVAYNHNEIEIDLGDPKWNSIKINKSGYTVSPHKEYLFRPKNTLPLTVPASSAKKLKLFKELFRLSEGDYKLIIGWLLGCFMPQEPYPILILQGQQGSGKSTLAKLLRSIIDPSKAPSTSLPEKEKDLYIQAKNNLILSYDNQRKLKFEISDRLCRISTGGGYSSRKLYTDFDEIELNFSRPIMLNGINNIATQSDLNSRAITINLNEITDSRMQMKDLDSIFNESRAEMLGELCDTVVAILNAEEPELRLGRMADFLVWVTKGEEKLGWDKFSFQRAYDNNKKEVSRARLETDPVFSTLTKLVSEHDSKKVFDGTPSELGNQLEARMNDQYTIGNFPKNVASFSKRLRQLQPDFYDLGIKVYFSKSGYRRIVVENHDFQPEPIEDDEGQSGQEGQEGRQMS